MTESRDEVSLSAYLEETGLALEDVYAGGRSWSDLRENAGLPVHAPGPDEETLRRAIGRLLHVDDTRRLDTYQRLCASEDRPALDSLPTRQQRLVRMLLASLLDQVLEKNTSVAEAVSVLWRHPQVRSELAELFEVLRRNLTHLQSGLEFHPDVPLQVHGRYTRLEILGAFGVGKGARIPPWQTGVRWIEEERTDVFAFTLDKTSGDFSPTTRYRDYAITRELIHWESQSMTRAESETGIRYQRHVEIGTNVMLFARLRTDDRSFWFLGPATYVSHEGELPLAVTWRLKHALPGDLFAAFAAAVA